MQSMNLKLAAIYILGFIVLVVCQPESSGSDFDGQVSPQSLVSKPAQSNKLTRDLKFKNDPTVSYCEVPLNDFSRYSGYRDLKLYPSASVSKVFLSAWVLKKLGPQFKFTHEWRYQKNADGSFDVYMNTQLDPVVNIEKSLYFMTELNKLGIKRIRNLYISSNTKVYLSVLTNPHIELEEVPISTNETVENLRIIFNSANWGEQTQIAIEKLRQSQKVIPTNFSVEKVSVVDEATKSKIANWDLHMTQSVEIKKYLKEVNTNSNNYISDALFSYLGGSKKFYQFQQVDLGLTKNDLYMLTGSGLATMTGGQRSDNLANCYSIAKVMNYVYLHSQKQKYNLGEILLNVGTDQGTYQPDNMVFNQSTVVKTGRLYDVPTLNLSGVVSTKYGPVAFAFLGHDFDNADELNMQSKRDTLLQSILDYYTEAPVAFKKVKLDTIFF